MEDKTMKKNIILLFALMGAMVLTSCLKSEDEPLSGEEGDAVAAREWTLSVQAVKSDNPATKGLGVDGDEADATLLKSIWKVGETVRAYIGTDYIGTLNATPDANDAHFARLSGQITTSSITPGVTQLTLFAPREEWSYEGQVGKLLLDDDASKSIEALYHYTLAVNVGIVSADVDADGKGSIVAEDATFANQQSIYRLSFRFQNGSSSAKVPIMTKSVTIESANGHLVRSCDLSGAALVEGPISVSLESASSEPFFVALRNGNETAPEQYDFTVIDADGVTYTGSKTIPAAYKPNGSFVSVKNATLTSRLQASLTPYITAEIW